MLNSAKQNIITFYNNFQQTFEQPGVKAPGTANRTPFLPANNSAMLTLPFGVPSMTWTDGSLSPTCYIIDDFLFSTNLTYIILYPPRLYGKLLKTYDLRLKFWKSYNPEN